MILLWSMEKENNTVSGEKNENSNSKGLIFWAGLSFVIPLTLIYFYSYSQHKISISGIELKKIFLEEKQEKRAILSASTQQSEEQSSLLHSSKLDTIFDPSPEQGERNLNDIEYTKTWNFGSNLDTTAQRILLMGDSECGGLCYQLNDYCQQNGHKLVLSFVWNSASIYNFAYSDTVNKIIEEFKPTYVFLVVGLNELYSKDIANRTSAAKLMAEKLSGIPYTWVGPANFMKDYGINNAFKLSAQEGTFYPTLNLTIPKGGDKRHPSQEGYKIWMDSLAVWVETKAKYKIKLAPPVKRNRHYRSRLINLNAAEYRGY